MVNSALIATVLPMAEPLPSLLLSNFSPHPSRAKLRASKPQ